METKEMKIQVPEGYEIDKEKSTFEKIVFKKVENELPKNFPNREEAEACLALAQLCQLRDRYNNGWKPNWEDYNETKYCIEFCQGRIETIDRVNCHKILTFKTEDLRDKFLENFKDLIETAKPLL